MTKTGNTLEKSLKKLVILLGLLIFSPISLNVAFKALRIYKTAPKIYIAYILLVLSILLILYAVYFGFKTFKGILDAIFNK